MSANGARIGIVPITIRTHRNGTQPALLQEGQVNFVLREVVMVDSEPSGLVVHRAVSLAKGYKLISVSVAPSRFPGSFPVHHTDGLPPWISLFQTTLLILLATTARAGGIATDFLHPCYRLGT